MNAKIRTLIAILALLAISWPLDAEAGIADWFRSDPIIISSPFFNRQSESDYLVKKPTESGPGISLIHNSAVVATSSPLSCPRLYYTPRTKTYLVPATAYSSTPDQTDSTPFITAAGTHVREGIVAANFLPLGTVIRIPEIYGDRTFVVEDRMHSRYSYRLDIWFPSRQEARDFGLKVIKIEIIS